MIIVTNTPSISGFSAGMICIAVDSSFPQRMIGKRSVREEEEEEDMAEMYMIMIAGSDLRFRRFRGLASDACCIGTEVHECGASALYKSGEVECEK